MKASDQVRADASIDAYNDCLLSDIDSEIPKRFFWEVNSTSFSDMGSIPPLVSMPPLIRI